MIIAAFVFGGLAGGILWSMRPERSVEDDFMDRVLRANTPRPMTKAEWRRS